MAMKKARAAMIRDMLADFRKIDRPATDDAGWIALKLSVSRANAQKAIDQAKRVLGDAWGLA